MHTLHLAALYCVLLDFARSFAKSTIWKVHVTWLFAGEECEEEEWPHSWHASIRDAHCNLSREGHWHGRWQ